MKLAVINIVEKSGASMATSLIASTASFIQELKTVITFTSNSADIITYLGLEDYINDNTRSISQVYKLMRARSMKPEDLDSYLLSVGENCFVLNTISDNLKVSEAAAVQKYCFERVPCDISICDISESIDDPRAQSLLGIADAVCYIINADEASIEAFNVLRQSEYFPKDKPFVVIVNRYIEEIMSTRDLAKKMGLKVSQVLPIHFNGWLTRASNNNFLSQIVPYAMDDDQRVMQCKADMQRVMNWLSNFLDRKAKRVRRQ
jgi:hypothetical protein